MKKIISLLLIFIMSLFIFPNVYASNSVTIESITLKEKSEDLIELSKPSINGMNLGFNLSFLNIGDKAKYEVIISNNSNKDYYIDNETKFNKSSYITYTYEFDEKVDKIKRNSKLKMYITIEYTTLVPPEKLVNGMYTEDNAMSMDLSDVILTNPSTYSNIIVFILIIITLLVLTIINISKKKKIGINILLIGLLLIPITTYALEKITIKAQTKITIEEQRNVLESRYVNGITNVERDFWQYESYIKSVTFETKIEEPSNYEYKFDVSEEKNNSIIAYLVENNNDPTYYDLYIMSNGYIYANPDSSKLFYCFIKLETINNLNNYKTIYATNMSGMFWFARRVEELDLTSFDTSNVTDMSYMFSQGYGSTHGGLLKSINLSSFDTSKVTNMECMFYDCDHLTELDVTTFNTSNVTNMLDMFGNCNKLETIDVSNFNTKNVTNMAYMFVECKSLKELDLSSFDTSNINDLHYMFGYSINLQTIYVSEKWNVDPSTSSTDMFAGCTKLPNFDPNVVDATNANTSPTGYLTLKS